MVRNQRRDTSQEGHSWRVIDELERRRYGASIQRLAAGRYHFPAATAAGIELSATQFALILDGIDLSRVRRFKRFTPAHAEKIRPQ